MKTFRHERLNKQTLGGRVRALPEEPLDPSSLLETIQKSKSVDNNFVVQYVSPLFFRFRDPSSWDLICMQIMIEAIRRGILKYRIEFISIPPEIDTFIENRSPSRGRTTESGVHAGMKLWVIDYLSEKGMGVSEAEVSQLGYRVDVACLARSVFVECGDTETRKVFEFLKHGYDIGILQYDSEDIVWFLSSAEFKAFADGEWLNKIL